MQNTSPTVHESPVKVSVVVPTHNTGKTVLTGLRSFLAQTMPRPDFEVIYVDDGSTDDTVALLEAEVAAQGAESVVRLIRIPNSGWPGRPRNIGMDAARGEFVHFVDDDDWLAPEALERTYARAQETGADIVAGRMAGHGRRAPRALFEKPIAAADLRSDTELLSSMTVHKLFRRSFLQENQLRFVEGQVRLEDHMFTLRAYLLTGRVATVHDYTCYHWVRHEGEDHNISYERIEPGPYVDSVRRVLAILDAPDTRVTPGRHRYRLAANWYGKKALARISGQRFLDQSGPRKAEWLDAVGALAADMPPKADAALTTRLRIVAALARHRELEPLVEQAEFEAGVDHRPRVRSAGWKDGRLTVRCETRLVRRKGRGATSSPLVFSRAGGRRLLRLPPRVAAVPGASEAADFTKAVQRSNVRGLLRHREGGTVLSVPLTHRVVEVPVRDEGTAAEPVARAARRMGLPAGLTSRLQGTGRNQEDPDACSLSFETEFTVDPSTADNGKPLAPGTWDLQLQLGCGGWRFARALRGYSIDVPAEPARAAPAVRAPGRLPRPRPLRGRQAVPAARG
ncbi:glycosyltransferase family 2 protein [Streptomyces bathyalis]|uniref:Glycosyltransferase family 2 protein n=1 Tax=Streptomyces bathyalis TaxID=2710756 RepID=A0A7T1T7Z6_9ACTN|nr:glycosyltransferase family 2 protein [Streptomyces bathyalis]QPP07978.1 glycosyltransferase family 2 protein [Streptomyces bathyalis]